MFLTMGAQISQPSYQSKVGILTANADGVLDDSSNVEVTLSCFLDSRKPRGEAGRNELI